jgi:hypothetical protein
MILQEVASKIIYKVKWFHSTVQGLSKKKFQFSLYIFTEYPRNIMLGVTEHESLEGESQLKTFLICVSSFS